METDRAGAVFDKAGGVLGVGTAIGERAALARLHHFAAHSEGDDVGDGLEEGDLLRRKNRFSKMIHFQKKFQVKNIFAKFSFQTRCSASAEREREIMIFHR